MDTRRVREDAHEGPNENAIALLSDNKTAFVVMRLGAGD